MADLYKACKIKIRIQQELDEHRRRGHATYSSDCPECKRGAAVGRSHERVFTRQGGELSVDITGPMLVDGVPVTDRPVSRKDWGKYLLVGVFTPFGVKEAQARCEH